MKKRIYPLAAALLVVAAAGFFSGRHIYLHGELPRTVENIAGEWFFRQFHTTNVDPQADDQWTDDYPTGEYNTFFTLHFDTNDWECTKCKHEDAQIVHSWAYYWDLLDDDTLVLWNKYDWEEFRIDRLTRSQLVLVIRRENMRGETCESTYCYERIGNTDSSHCSAISRAVV